MWRQRVARQRERRLSNELRLPLVSVQSQAVKDEIKAAMQEAGVL